MDAVKEDMQVVGIRVEDTETRLKWEMIILQWQPLKRYKPNGKEEEWTAILQCFPCQRALLPNSAFIVFL